MVANLNRAIGALLEKDERVYLLGEDVVDPYGGAFKVSSGLSTRFPDRVLSTPISEGAIAGLAGGLALAGDRPIIEVMFGDFIGLCFDQIYNFAAKSVTMYGRRVPMHMLVRCPVGGNRGYGPTHSQSPHKHFIGIPNLSLWEMSPLHDNEAVLARILDGGEPGIFFEDKVLYGRRMYQNGEISELFEYDFLDAERNYARIFVGGPEQYDCLVIAAGGMVERVVQAATDLLLEQEITCQIVVPSRLYPFDLEPLVPAARAARLVCVVEEGTAGGTWGSEVAGLLHERLWGDLKHPVLRVNSADSVIPSARHLESGILVQADTVCRAISEAFHA